MYLVLIILPFFSFIFTVLGSRWFGHRGALIISLSLVSSGLFLAIAAFYEVVLLGNPSYMTLGSWITAGPLDVLWSFTFDFLSISMALTVYIVSAIVHYYSSQYMWGDPHLPRFMSYLSFFTFFMLVLVTAGNLPQLFIGWEGVGLCSYLLVSFWFTRTQANTASLKAFIYNRIGDAFFISGMALLFLSFYSLEFSTMSLAAYHQSKSFVAYPHILGSEHFFFQKIRLFSILNLKWGELACLCLFVGVMSKSAQIFLHAWLPDAMEGPTPVSALIHAATMVVAGVYLLLRLGFILDLLPFVLEVIALVGALTCLFSATTAVFQNDLKKIIAYSTCSQLGYMVFIAGLSFYSACFFHLCSHAFFKALLFLSAGSVIHSIGDIQDIRKMGGLASKLPLTYSSFLVASIALAGLPFLSGFFSKELILETASQSKNFFSYFCKALGILSAFFTAAYSFKLIYFTFFINTKTAKSLFSKVYEGFDPITNSLIILSFFSIFFGFFWKDLFTGFASVNVFAFNPFSENFIRINDSEFLPYFYKILPLLFSLGGLYFAFFFTTVKGKHYNFIKHLFSFFSKKWFFDNVHTSLIAKPTLVFAYHNLYKILDKGYIEYLGPRALKGFFYYFAAFLKKLQTGQLYYYLYFISSFIIVITLIVHSAYIFAKKPVFLQYYVLAFLYIFALLNLDRKKDNEL